MKKGMKCQNCRKFITAVNLGINAVIAVATVHMTSEQQEQGMKEYMQTYADLCALGEYTAWVDSPHVPRVWNSITKEENDFLLWA